MVGFVRDQLGPHKVSAVDDAVADVGDVLLAADLGDTIVVDQSLNEDIEGIGLGGHLLVFDFLVVDYFLAMPCVSKGGRWCGQAAYLGFGKLDGRLAEESAVG